nr:hypothetical protein [Tanacetum cinerariifolium]
MLDWKPQYHRRKSHFKWSLILSRTPQASRRSLSMQMSQKSLCSSSGVNFTDVPDDDTTLAFLIKLGYKGLRWKIPPKKIRGKGSQRKKTVDDFKETFDVSEESKRKPELVKGKTASRRVVKKKVTIFADDNIITDDPNVALELGKPVSLTKAKEAEATRKVHVTHAKIVTEFVLEFAKKKSGGKSYREAANIMQALKESKKTNKRQPCTGGSNDGTGTIPGVADESTVVSVTSSEATGDEEVTDAAKEDTKNTSEVKDDAKKTELPPTSSSLYVSLGFGDQFIKISSDSSLVGTVKDTTNAEFNSFLEPLVLTPVQESPLIATVITLPPLSVSTTPSVPQQTTTPIPIPPITTDALTITTTVLKSDAISAVQLRVSKFEKDVSKHKKIDLSTEALAALTTQVPSVVDNYPGSKTSTVDLEQELEKNPSEILKIKKEQAKKQNMLTFTIMSTHKATLKEFDQKSTLYQTMHCKKTKRRRTKELESSKKPSTTKDTPKGKAPSKGFKTGKSTIAKEPVEEPTAEVVMDDVGEDVVYDDDQPQGASEPKTTKTSNLD